MEIPIRRSLVNSVIGNLKDDPRSLYRFIKSKQTELTGIPTLKTADGSLISSDAEKASEPILRICL